jgi:hypothetical protein
MANARICQAGDIMVSKKPQTWRKSVTLILRDIRRV